MVLNKLNKHENNTDVAILPTKAHYIPEKNGYSVKVSWYNIVNPKNIYPCGLTETIFIKKEDITKWKLYE